MFVLAAIIAAQVGGSTVSDVEFKDFDKLWDYSKPAETEKKFRELLPRMEKDAGLDLTLQLQTQIGRTLGLRGKFDEAHAVFDAVQPRLTADTKLAHVRYLLERGRTFNSSKKVDKAIPLFEDALKRATQLENEFHAVDAAHMLGIACPPDRALEWNLKAIDMAEKAKDPRAKGWLGALLNNTGWTYHGKGDYKRALELFEKALAYRSDKKQKKETRIAEWSVARCLRSLDRVDEALVRQQALLAEYQADPNAEDTGFTHEEVGECLWAMDRKSEAKPYLAKAYLLLKKINWVEEDRLKSLAERGDVELDKAD